MHLSLKGSLIRSPMLNRVGQRLLQLFEGASAAYSLRDLASNIASVVRVRRASDNSEKDFSAADVSSGAMTQWVNGQVVPPLDVRELVDGERTGDLVEAAAAYSLRNLSASYTGNVVDVRRSSDDAEDSFTAAEVADGTLTTWVGAGNDGFVTQWYDQSGNANHATQGTDASQPKIVDGGSLVSGGMDFDGVNDELVVSGNPVITANYAGTYSAFSVQKVSTSNRGYLYGNASTTDGSSLYASNIPLFGLSNKNAASNYDVISRDGSKSLLSAVYNNGDAGLLVNGSGTMTDVGTYDFSSGTDDFIIGNRNGGTTDGTFLDGTIQEIIIYNSDQSDNRTAIEANIGETYGIDLPSGVDTGYDQVDGFVETWYDQSGNVNDAVQQVSGSQPKIVSGGVLVSGGIDFDGVNDELKAASFSASQPITSFSVFTQDSVSSTIYGSGGSHAIITSSANKISLNAGTALVSSASISLGTQALVSALSNSTSSFTYINGGNVTTGDAGTTAIASPLRLGNTNSNRFMGGKFQEFIIYPSDQSANRAAIEANINNQYDIY